MTSLDLVLKLLDQGYDGKAWHGPTLRGSVRRVDVATAAWRSAPERHNIWEHVVHAAYWKYIVRRRLLGEKRGSFPLKGSNWFVRPLADSNEETWEKDLALLDATHCSLREAVAEMDAKMLDVTPKSSKVSNWQILSGIAAHDVYHAGQIQLLRRLAAAA
jgi:uncharacterized damage-inducible protein DinB